MESNGKSVGVDGRSVLGGTSPVVWGEAGTNGQHAFFQMLHQGTQVVPVEFVTTGASLGTDNEAHDLLFANVIAQSEALAAGRAHSEPHKSFEGNRPSSVLVLDELSPRCLGSLIAMYEHSATIQGWLMGINSFDQWGVELGKVLAIDAASAIANASQRDTKTMTHPLLNWYISIRKKLPRNQ
jgi:glucose-6-phosphate isomerase